MFRLGHLVHGEWVAFSQPAVFECGGRIVAGVAGSDPLVFERLVEQLEPPYYLLYLLHTPRGEAEPGRYQSPKLSLTEVTAFLARFRRFLSADARFDLWAHAPSENATVVWDRHDKLFAYGPLDRYASALERSASARGLRRFQKPSSTQLPPRVLTIWRVNSSANFPGTTRHCGQRICNEWVRPVPRAPTPRRSRTHPRNSSVRTRRLNLVGTRISLAW